MKLSARFVLMSVTLFFICLVSSADEVKNILENRAAEKAEFRNVTRNRKITMHYPDGYEDLIGEYKGRVKKIFRDVRIDLNFKAIPSERGVSMLESGESASELARSIDIAETVESNYFYISTPLDVLELSYIYKSDGVKHLSDFDHRSARVGYMRGGRASQKASEKFQHSHALKDKESLFKMLDNKRLELFFMLTNKKQREELNNRNYKVGFVEKYPVYTYLRKDFEAYKEKLEAAYIAEFKND